MVGVGRIELPTPAMSTQCSTTELYAHVFTSKPGGGGSLYLPGRGRPLARVFCRCKRLDDLFVRFFSIAGFAGLNCRQSA